MKIGDTVEIWSDSLKRTAKIRKGRIVEISNHVFVVEFLCKKSTYRESFRINDMPKLWRVVG